MIGTVHARAGMPVKLSGEAYDLGHAIAGIQFSLDEGAHWKTYETPNTNDYQNLKWNFLYTPEKPGVYRLLIRSVNDRGFASPEAASATLVVT